MELDGLKEAVLGGLEEVTVPGEVLEARHLALQQSIVKHKTSLLETLCHTIEKLLVTESEANPNHCVSSGDIVLVLGHFAGSLNLYQFFRNRNSFSCAWISCWFCPFGLVVPTKCYAASGHLGAPEEKTINTNFVC